MSTLRRVEKETDLAQADLKRHREEYVLLDRENEVDMGRIDSDTVSGSGNSKRRIRAVGDDNGNSF